MVASLMVGLGIGIALFILQGFKMDAKKRRREAERKARNG